MRDMKIQHGGSLQGTSARHEDTAWGSLQGTSGRHEDTAEGVTTRH